MKIIFQFAHYWWLHDRHGVKAYIRKFKGILMWHFWVLEHVGIVLKCIFKFVDGFRECPSILIERVKWLEWWFLHEINLYA